MHDFITKIKNLNKYQLIYLFLRKKKKQSVVHEEKPVE